MIADVMDENFIAMGPAHEQRIRAWMMETASNGGVERLDDLHIDEIDPDWKDRSTWVVAACLVFSRSIKIRDDLDLPLTVVLAFSMHPGEADAFDSVTFLQEQFDWSPPSLYLIKRDRSLAEGAASKSVTLPSEMLTILPSGATPQLLQWTQADGERRRTLIIRK